MEPTSPAPSPPSSLGPLPAVPAGYDLVAEGAALRVALTGALRLGAVTPLLADLRRALAAGPGGARRVEIDLARLDAVDAGALVALLRLREEVRARGLECELTRADGAKAALLRLLDCESCAPLHGPPKGLGLLAHIGDASLELARVTASIFAFVGDLVVSVGRAARRPHLVHWADTLRLMERAGADGVPIVFLMNFLVGMVMGFQGAIQLRQFGADIYVADLVALVQVRELGPLMTAIIVAGRTGAAFAAELGTMRVSEEVDALHTLGLDRYHFLVLPRLVALVLVVPLLSVVGDLVGIVGGAFVGVAGLGLTTSAYFTETRAAIDLWDVGSGLVKSVFFAGAIALIACQRGLATRGGAEGVGRATTSAVVAAIFSIVVIDSVFSVVYHLLGV